MRISPLKEKCHRSREQDVAEKRIERSRHVRKELASGMYSLAKQEKQLRSFDRARRRKKLCVLTFDVLARKDFEGFFQRLDLFLTALDAIVVGHARVDARRLELFIVR